MADQNYLSGTQWGKIVAKAWVHPDFREELEKDPTATIRKFARDEFGVELVCVLRLPPCPTDMIVEDLTGGRIHAYGTGSGCGTAHGGGTGGRGTTLGGSWEAAPGPAAGTGTGCGTGSGCGTAHGGGTGGRGTTLGGSWEAAPGPAAGTGTGCGTGSGCATTLGSGWEATPGSAAGTGTGCGTGSGCATHGGHSTEGSGT